MDWAHRDHPKAGDDLVETIHGVDVADPYRWLEDPEAPEVRDWIDRQNAYSERIIGSLRGRFATC